MAVASVIASRCQNDPIAHRSPVAHDACQSPSANIDCDEQVIDDEVIDSQAERCQPREPICVRLRLSAVLFFLTALRAKEGFQPRMIADGPQA
jgi:hypothetical protein